MSSLIVSCIHKAGDAKASGIIYDWLKSREAGATTPLQPIISTLIGPIFHIFRIIGCSKPI
jgi:hypothetical protein